MKPLDSTTRNRSNSSLVNRSRSNSFRPKPDQAKLPAVSFDNGLAIHKPGTAGNETNLNTSSPSPVPSPVPSPANPTTKDHNHKDDSLHIRDLIIKPIKSSEDLGIFSSLLTMAHDTIAHKTGKHRPTEPAPNQNYSLDDIAHTMSSTSNPQFYTHDDTSFSNQLDSLINQPGRQGESRSQRDESRSQLDGDQSQNGTQSPNQGQLGQNGGQDGTLSPTNIHFASVRDSPIASLGNGDLSLDDFQDSRKDDDLDSKVQQITNDRRMKQRKNNGDQLSDQESVLSDVNYSSIKYASKKRNREFHQTFKKIPSNENLIDDFSCALSKDILVHGRLYLSENYLCFKSNILGWVTNLMIPLQEVVQIEKRSTAVLFPNGIIIRTLYQKYTFATFIYRDSTFKMVTSVWHQVLLDHEEKRPVLDRESDDSDYSLGLESEESDEEYEEDDEEVDTGKQITSNGPSEQEADSEGGMDDSDSDVSEGPVDADVNGDSLDQDDLKEDVKDINGQENNNLIPKDSNSFNGLPLVGPLTHEAVPLDYTKQSSDTFIAEDEFSAPLGVVFNVLFGSDSSYYIKILKNQNNIQIEEDNITGLQKQGDERNYKYVKPLGGSIGPKQTSCIISDQVLEFNINKAIVVEQTTSTPDVPSGNAFKIRTKIFIYWGEKNHTKIYVITNIEWTGKSWIKGPIEKGSIDGQKESMKILIDTVNEIVKSGDGQKLKKPRKKSESKRSKSVSTPDTPPTPAPEPEKSFTGKLNELVQMIGEAMPISIPMVSPLIVGYVIVALMFLVAVYGYNLVTGGGHRNVITLAGDSITINKDRYLLTPSVENQINNEQVNLDSQVQLWKWIRNRTGDKLPIGGGDYLQQYSNQELEDIVRLTQMKLDQLRERLDR